MSNTYRVTDSTFDTYVLSSDVPVLVDFWASWCPPCKMVEPILEELATDLKGKLRIFMLNTDQNPVSVSVNNIVGVPTFVLFKEGNELQRRVGALSKTQILNMISDSL